jgi:allantoinase
MVEQGAKGFKCFLIETQLGVRRFIYLRVKLLLDGALMQEFPMVTEADLKPAMKALEPTGTVLLFHAELDEHAHDEPTTDESTKDPSLYETYLSSRPAKWEIDAISSIINMQKSYPGLRCHIVHLSTAQALPLIRDAKANGAKLTVETCFHYLCLSSSTIPDGRAEFKCSPPIRDEANREALWEALLDGTIDSVVSDHSPCVPEKKRVGVNGTDLMQAWAGISTLGLGLNLLWTEASKRGVGIDKIVHWMSEQTAVHGGLQDRKGKIAVGYDADFIVFDPNAEYTVCHV